MEPNTVLRDFKGSISLRAQETGSGFRFFFDDDEESYFDLNLEKMGDSEEFEFQISFSPLPAAGLPAQFPADELFQSGRILPLPGFQVVETRSLLLSSSEARQGYPAERLVPESSVAVDEVAGRVNLKAQVEPSSENGQRFDGVRQCMEEKQHMGLTGSRKTSKVAAKKINNGMMKFLIKFPSDKIRSTFTSVIRSSRFLSLQPERGQSEGGAQERGGMYQRLVMRLSRWMAIGKRSHSKGSKNVDTSSQRPSDVELNEDIVRSMLGAVDFAVGGRSRGAVSGGDARQSSSSASSPMKEMEGAVERNNSIKSAIAHCKMSYGNTGC